MSGAYRRAAPLPAVDVFMAAAFIKGKFGESTQHEIYLSSLVNSEHKAVDRGREERKVTRDMRAVGKFVNDWSMPRRGTFFCVATLIPGAAPREPHGSPRIKENVAECNCFHSDIDLKDIDLSVDDVLRLLLQLPRPPSVIVRSGGGLHCYWLLKEPIIIEGDFARIEMVEGVNRQLADLVAGDLNAVDIGRLMRMPGSLNTKRDAVVIVEVVKDHYGLRYEPDEIEDMVCTMSPIVKRKLSSRPAPDRAPTDLWSALADQIGWKPPIDVAARLDAMSFNGPGETAIHATQLSVSASMLNSGVDADVIVETLLRATKVASGDQGGRWNWAREEKAIRGMVRDWGRKHPDAVAEGVARLAKREELIGLAVGSEAVEPAQAAAETAAEPVEAEVAPEPEPAPVRPPFRPQIVGGTAAAAVAMKDAPAVPKDKKKRDEPLEPIVVEGTLTVVRKTGRDVLTTDGSMWLYREGVWTAFRTKDEQWLQVEVQKTCERIKMPGDTKLSGAARKLMNEYPAIYREDVVWDGGNLVVCGNGVLDIRTREFGSFDPAHYCRQKIGMRFEPSAECPTFLRFLDGCWPDHSEEDRRGIIDLLQEWFGSMLSVKRLVREQRKALFLKGKSRTGKTQISTIARRLIGDPIASPSVADLGKEFGLQTLIGARAWIKDDAVNQTDQLDPARFKALVTGEYLDVNAKNRAPVSVSFEIPILLTANALPRAQDSSDAIYNRSLIIPMDNVMDEEQAAEACRALGFDNAEALAESIVDLEGPGILNWALAGLERLMARGRYDIPEVVKAALRQFKESNNPTEEFAVACLELDQCTRIERGDLLCAYHSWQKSEHGGDGKPIGFKTLRPRLEAIFAGIDANVGSHGRRYIGGLRLSAEGLAMWEAGRNDTLRGGSVGTSNSRSEVNGHWTKPVF